MVPTHLQYKLVFRVPLHTQAGAIRTQVVKRMLAEFRKAGVPLSDTRPK
jgi:hypothetical protein